MPATSNVNKSCMRGRIRDFPVAVTPIVFPVHVTIPCNAVCRLLNSCQLDHLCKIDPRNVRLVL